MSLFDYSLGDFVTHSERPDWGVGQVQSIEGTRITVNFEHVGKQLINAEIILLIPVAAETE
jgi:transcription elongation factor GreA-like protein|tara:strand:- start:724 stop:906 length:183 start_codon:yes stop_codon:yes gene_type:complete